MATQVSAIDNRTKSTLRLTNTFAGKVRPTDSQTIPPGRVKTPGADNDFIDIPDATPLAEYFPKDFMAISGIQVGSETHQVNIAKVSDQNNLVWWALDGFKNPMSLNGSQDYTQGVVIISTNSPSITVEMVKA